MTLQARMDALAAQGVHTVMAQFTDLHGAVKGKLLPLEQLPQAVEVGAGFSGPSIWGTGLPRHGAHSEYYGRIQPHSLQALPFMPGVARAVCDGYANGEPLPTCSRQLLKAQLARLRSMGLTLWVGVEPEFFLLRKDVQGRWVGADDADALDKPSYDLKAMGRRYAFLEAMRQHLTTMGFALQQTDHEDAPNQYEINYRHDEALAAADRYQLFKLTAQAVSEQHGMVFSCMPKPFSRVPGSGLHWHLSLTDDAGRAVMADAHGVCGLSKVGLQFVAGLLVHADALCTLCAPTVNSYRRLASSASASGTTWSPVWKAYGDNNRTCVIRTVQGRLEWRLPDPSCNIYAALAATLAAGLDGMARGLMPPEPCDEDLYVRNAKGVAMPERLPRDLCAALDALEADAPLRTLVGDAFCDQFLQIKRDEWDAYHQQVSDWEMQRYAAGA